MSNYWSNLQKELEEEEDKKRRRQNHSSDSSSKSSDSSNYWQDRQNELDEEIERKNSSSDEDIAPVKVQYPTTNERRTPTQAVREFFGIGEKDEDDGRTWFKKSEGDTGEAVGGTLADVGHKLLSGAVDFFGEKLPDALLYMGNVMAQNSMMESAQSQMMLNTLTGNNEANEGLLERTLADNAYIEEQTVEEIKKDRVDDEAVAKEILAGLYSAAYQYNVTQSGGYMTQADWETANMLRDSAQEYLDEDMERYTVLGEKSQDLAKSGGQLLAQTALSPVVPWYVTSFAATFGGEVENALNNGATFEEAGFSATISASAEVLTEKIGGIKFGGTAISDLMAKKFSSVVSNKIAQYAVKAGLDMAGEGAEEVLSGLASAVGQKMSYMSEAELNELFSSEDALDAFIGGVVLGGTATGSQMVTSAVNGENYVTGLKKSEEAVVNAVVKDEIAKREKDGKELTLKEKSKIYDSTVEALEKGYIDTDTIESVLGGEDYSNYKKELDRQEAIKKELDELRNMKSGEMTDIQIERMAELKAMKPNTEMMNTLKFTVDEKISSAVKDTRLVESYNEVARRSQAYEADVNQYEGLAKESIQDIIKKGQIQNTNRAHDIVNFAVRSAADRGYRVTTTTTKEILDKARQQYGDEYVRDNFFEYNEKTGEWELTTIPNAEIDKDGKVIALNVNSPNLSRAIIGHEVGHTLEKSQYYDEFKDVLFAFDAKKKGDKAFATRKQNTGAKYENIKGANADYELTNDLIGEYIYEADPEFVQSLYTKNHNLFTTIWDRIKYLYKMATAGSAQQRDLLRIEQQYAKVYRDAQKMEKAGSAEASGVATEGFVGSYSGTQYNATQAKLLADVSTEGIQNATDLASRQDIGFNHIGISDAKTKQAWLDAGLAYTEKNADGDDITVVNEAMLMDERERRQKLAKTEGGTKLSLSENKIINTLTGAEIDGNTYKVLERLGKGEDVLPSEIANLKEVQEGKIKLDELRQSFIAEHPEFSSVSEDEVGTYLLKNDDERIQLQEKIISERLQEGSFSGIDKNGNEEYNGSVEKGKRLDIVIGLPASGKSSSIVNPLSEFYHSAVIDSDIIKRKLPEFNDGWGGSLVHEESSEINTRLLIDSLKSGNNIVLPIVGSKVSSVEKYIELAKERGYSINVHLNELSNGKAVGRALRRYFSDGRFISLDYISSLGNKPSEVYELIKQRSDISGYSRWNNDVAKGQRPTLAEISENNGVYGSYSGTWGQSGRANVRQSDSGSTGGETKTNNEIAPINEASSTDGVFFDGNNPQYSLSDSDGKQLTKEQGEYFKDSKMRDDNGNLKVMYHGSQDAGFHIFDSSMSDDDTSFFFVDRNDVAASYSGTSETYEAQTIRSAEDMNNFIESIGAEGYEVVEKDGKFTLLYEGDRVADSKTAQGIYDEFCWYEGVGEGDANYKVYLNLTNPLVVDAEGRNWNNISREYSQEIADRYNSLTAEEKAALTDLTEWEDFQAFRDEILSVLEQQSIAPVGEDQVHLASAIDKLGGNNINISNLFSIASDDFSAESIQEFAVKQMNTRDYAQKAKAEGYDGVIFKNIHDNGGYSNGSEGASTVAIAFESNQIKSVANEKPTGNPDIRYSLSEDSEGRELSPAVKNRFANSKVVDENGSLKVVYHGTYRGEFSIFDKSKGSVEGDFGSGFYFTDNEYDVSRNYEDGGPDFDNKVERRAEQIEMDEEIDYDEAKEKARKELYRGGHKFEVYLNIENPAIVGETMLLESDSYFSQYDQEDYDSEDDYYGDVEQLMADDIDGIIWDIQNKVDVDSTDEIAEVLWTAINDGGIGIAELKSKLNDLYLEDSDGNLVANEVARQIIESLGYDGIIDNTVSSKFKNMGLTEDTTHYIVFKPNQIKAVTNANPTDNPDINLSLSGVNEQFAPTGNDVPLRDLRLETQEDIAPVDKAVDKAVAPEDIYDAPSEANLYDLYRERDALLKQGREAGAVGDMTAIEQLAEKYDTLDAKIKQMEAEQSNMQSERLASLDDAKAPLETDDGYYNIPDTSRLNDESVKSISDTVKDILTLNDAEAATLGDIVQRYSTQEISEEQLFDEIKENFGTRVEEYEDTDLKDAKRHIRKYPFKISDMIKQEIAYKYGSYNDFRKHHFGKIRMQKDGLGVDSVYMELSELYPQYFPADVENPADQFFLICDVVDADVKKSEAYRVSDEDIQEVVDVIATEVGIAKDADMLRLVEEDRQAFMDDIAPVAESQVVNDKAYEAIRPKRESKEPKLIRVKDGEDIAPTFETKKNGQRQRTMFEDGKTAEILTKEPEVAEKKNRAGSWIARNLIDKFSVFETLSLKTGNRKLQAKANFMHRSEARAQRFIGKGADGVRALNDVRKEVEKSGQTEQFYKYMYHALNVDRMTLEERYDIPNKAVFGDSVTAEVSRKTVAEIEAENPHFKKWAQELYDITAHLRKQLVHDGVISQETADLWAEMYPHYVPVRRVGDSGLNINVPLDTGRTGVNAPIKRATGGNSDILPLFDTMAMRIEQTYKAGAKNSFGVELKNTLGTTIEKNTATLDEAIDSVDKHEELLKKGENGANPTFTVFENGEKVTFEITEEMYRALKPKAEELTTAENTKLAKFLNAVNNFRRGLITEYNPTFIVTNAWKDSQDVLMNSQHAATTYANMPVAIVDMVHNGKWTQEYLENGGEGLTYFDGKKKTFKEDKGIKKVIGMPLRAISAANNFVERVPRLAEYIASRKAGASIEEAMLDAARVTTDFASGGDITKFANKHGATFLNASVQGAAQQVRNIREAKAKGFKGWVQLAAKTAIAGIPALILNNLLWDDDEEYEELSDYVKDNYYIVAKYGDGQFVRIPKGRTVAVIQEAFEQVSNALTGDDEVDLANFCELVISNLAPNNPIDNNIISPVAQALTNKTWYGEDLVPTRLQDLPAAEQYDESTDSISKWLGENTNTSPMKWNYLLDQYSGGVGDVFLPMLTPEAERGDNTLAGNIVAPFKDKFTTDSVMNNQNVSDFYTTKDELAVNANGSNATDEDLLKYKYINSVSAELGELYKLKREVQNSNLSDARKYEKVRDIQAEINAIARESLNTYNDVYIDDGYAVIGDREYKLNDKGEWEKISDKQAAKQDEVTSDLGISESDYWSNKSEYDFAYEYPEKYAVAKSVGGYEAYKTYNSELYDIKADKDENGKTIVGSRKDKVADYINNLDIDYGMKIILYKSEYKADDTYNNEIVEYLNSREDISYEEMVTILTELGFTVKGDTVYWD